MKIRHGFVSNSSSSSYVLCTSEPLTEEFLEGLIGITEDNIFFPVVQELTGTIVGEFHKIERIEENEDGEKYAYGDDGRNNEYYITEHVDELLQIGWYGYVAHIPWYNEDEGYGITMLEHSNLLKELGTRFPKKYYIYD